MDMKYNQTLREKCTTRNKKEYITKLSDVTGYQLEECEKINRILESQFFLSQKGKQLVIEQLIEQLKISEENANVLYNQSIEIIKNEIKNKWKYPFRSNKKDKQ